MEELVASEMLQNDQLWIALLHFKFTRSEVACPWAVGENQAV